MYIQIALFFLCFLAIGADAASEEEKQQLLQMVVSELSQKIYPACFGLVIPGLREDFKHAIDKYLKRLVGGFPVVNDGMSFSITKFISNSTLNNNNGSIPEYCIRETRNAFRSYIKARFGSIVSE